jgi:predicted O-methyltransferase YrrM
VKRLYVSSLRLVRRLLQAIGVLGWLDRRATRSVWARWLRSLLAIYDLEDLARLDVPWWTFESAELVARFLADRPGARVFEWGSGSSSLWLAARVGEVISVEHDPEWADAVRAIARPNMRVVTVPPVASTQPATPSDKPGFEGLDFTDYVRAVDDEDGEFDLVVVDGRARNACFDAALPRVSPGGLVVFDNVDRERYREAIARHDGAVTVTWTRGLTPCLPYPTRTAVVALRHDV